MRGVCGRRRFCVMREKDRQKEKALRVEVPFFVVWVVVLSHQNKKEEKMSNKIFLAVAEIVAVGVAAFVILKVFGIW